MRNRASVLIFVFALALIGVSVNAQELPRSLQERKQRIQEKIRNEKARYDWVNNSRNLAEYEQFIADYPNGRFTEEIKKQAEEIRLWERAESANTITAYENYLNKSKYHWYDDEAEQGIVYLKRIAEQASWNKAKSQGTLYAYEQYLRENPNSGYRSEAEKMINQLKGAEAWTNVKNSNSIIELEQFVAQYPNAREISQAKNRLCELKGIAYYKNNQLSAAYSELSKLSRSQLSETGKKAYDAAVEYKDYIILSNYSSESELLSFMNKYPYSEYRSSVSNMLAMSKARNFGDYASTSDYNLALSYATDNATKTMVESYISSNKKEQKEREKRYKAYEREENGGWVNLGWNITDFGIGDGKGYYNTGLMLRVGNYADRVQFALGINLGLYINDEFSDNSSYYASRYGYDYDYDYDYDDEDTDAIPQIPIFAQLKLNLFNVSDNCKFYLMGEYHYNLLGDGTYDYEDWTSAWGTGLGFAWKHVDWSFNFRQNIDNDGAFGGTSIVYYWQL